MDFKVGVSLWAHSPSTGLSEAPGAEEDFMSHLRQDQQAVSSGQKNLNESFHKNLPQGSEQKLPLAKPMSLVCIGLMAEIRIRWQSCTPWV
jgi:hypothetical protein